MFDADALCHAVTLTLIICSTSGVTRSNYVRHLREIKHSVAELLTI